MLVHTQMHTDFACTCAAETVAHARLAQARRLSVNDHACRLWQTLGSFNRGDWGALAGGVLAAVIVAPVVVVVIIVALVVYCCCCRRKQGATPTYAGKEAQPPAY